MTAQAAAGRRRRRRLEETALRRGGGPRRLPELLGRILDPAARRRGLAEVRLVTDWAMVVGPALAARCQPIRLTGRRGEDGVLTIHVGGASALELQHSAPQLIERINDFFGYPAVGRLRLIQAPPARPVKRPAIGPIRTLDPAETIEIEAVAEAITDPGLRQALVRLGRTVKTWPVAAPSAELCSDGGRADR